eukprot:13744149-Alexandrium_andersonii.AAC.1
MAPFPRPRASAAAALTAPMGAAMAAESAAIATAATTPVPETHFIGDSDDELSDHQLAHALGADAAFFRTPSPRRSAAPSGIAIAASRVNQHGDEPPFHEAAEVEEIS